MPVNETLKLNTRSSYDLSLTTSWTPSLTTTMDKMEPVSLGNPLLSHEAYTSILYGLSCSLICTGATGMIANIIVIATYIKMGFKESINISYCALGISDLGVTITTCWGGITNILILTDAKLPFSPLDISDFTVFWPLEGLEKTTTCITAYITLERLLCVVFPLHVKTIVTRRKTVFVLVSIFLFVFGPTAFSVLRFKFRWVLLPDTNRTFMVMLRGPHYSEFNLFLGMYLSITINFTFLAVVWICTISLAVTLRRSIKSRASTFSQGKDSASQVKTVRVIKMVLVIATVYLFCSTPRIIANLANLLREQFSAGGIYLRTYMITIVSCVQLSLCNSSINILIYIFISSKFRETAQNMLCTCKK